jgi:Sigma-70 region 2
MTHPGYPGEPGFPGMPLTGEAAGSSPTPAYPAAGRGQAGSEDEFARFYRENLPRLAAYLIYQGAPAHLAADLAQDAMATAWRRWAEITEPRAYVYKVAGRAYTRLAVHAPELSVGEVPEPTAVLPHPGMPRHGCSSRRSSRYSGRCPRASARSLRSPSMAGRPPR